jgi:hypothetical protein
MCSVLTLVVGIIVALLKGMIITRFWGCFWYGFLHLKLLPYGSIFVCCLTFVFVSNVFFYLWVLAQLYVVYSVSRTGLLDFPQFLPLLHTGIPRLMQRRFWRKVFELGYNPSIRIYYLLLFGALIDFPCKNHIKIFCLWAPESGLGLYFITSHRVKSPCRDAKIKNFNNKTQF